MTADAMPKEAVKVYFDFAKCVLDSFDDVGVRRRFGRVIGVTVTGALRPVII